MFTIFMFFPLHQKVSSYRARILLLSTFYFSVLIMMPTLVLEQVVWIGTNSDEVLMNEVMLAVSWLMKE